MTTTVRPGYLIDLLGELVLYGIGVACALTIYGDVSGVWARPAAGALAVALGIAAVRWLARPPSRRPVVRYPVIVLLGLAAAATAAGLTARDSTGVGWTLAGAILTVLTVLIPSGGPAAGSLLMAPVFVATGVLLVALAIVPLPDGPPMPKPFAIVGVAVAVSAFTMVRAGLPWLAAMMVVMGAGFLVAGAFLLPDRRLGLAPVASIVAGIGFAGLGGRLLHSYGTWHRLWTRCRALFQRTDRS